LPGVAEITAEWWTWSDVASVFRIDGIQQANEPRYLMLTTIRGVYQLYPSKNPEKISSQNCSQEMYERDPEGQLHRHSIMMLADDTGHDHHAVNTSTRRAIRFL
ncbi:hypothetical protein PoB_007495200, partial [Plakobranchus ocellatus]